MSRCCRAPRSRGRAEARRITPRGAAAGRHRPARVPSCPGAAATAVSSDGTVALPDGEAVPQGLPPHVAKMWENEQMLRMSTPLCRKGTAEEAAGGILFLASPMASYVTGHTLEVTGGFGI